MSVYFGNRWLDWLIWNVEDIRQYLHRVINFLCDFWKISVFFPVCTSFILSWGILTLFVSFFISRQVLKRWSTTQDKTIKLFFRSFRSFILFNFRSVKKIWHKLFSSCRPEKINTCKGRKGVLPKQIYYRNTRIADSRSFRHDTLSNSLAKRNGFLRPVTNKNTTENLKITTSI